IVIDSWGKIPSGLLYGHLQDLGNFDECLDISTNLTAATGQTNGQYCFASVPLLEDPSLKHPPLDHDKSAQGRVYEDLITISIGICVPDVCYPDLLTEIFQEATVDTLNGALKGIYVNSCMTSEKPNFEIINIVGILIFSIFGLLMLLSTLYDIYTDKFDKKTKEIYLAFSIIRNGRKLFQISQAKSDSSIDCLTGFRVLSMVWIILCHCYSMSPMLPMINKFDLIPWFKAASTMHITMATVSVDTFFFISGLLIAWLGFRELDKSNGKLNISLMYLHRYIRLTPPLAAVILYNVAIDKYIGTGPLREVYKEFNGNCRDNWWSTLLYIQNYANPLDICVSQTWYLAVDTQLYFLSPFVLIPLWKWGKKFIPIMFLLSFLSIGYVIVTFFDYGFNTFMGVLGDDQLRLTYIPTHARFSVWLLGLGFGYFMHRIKYKSIQLPKMIQLLGWILCFALIFAIIYGPYFTINADHETSVLEAAMYESLRRVTWGIALSWIIFACHFGFAGLVNAFLSHYIWQPLGRLTYSMYLVHLTVQSVHYGITKNDVYFSDYSAILVFWGTFGTSFIAAIIVTLAFESPVLVIEKSFFHGSKQSMDTKKETV
ncbi:nose resistant to fluoxetine protein 6-like, partial [Episyrphus balteatus]|uniref:nose resistant to fluoxetine protein 6-like n=1 Tax=Episyrphus balteatus TaxID=286459 RepID=UPI002485A978